MALTLRFHNTDLSVCRLALSTFIPAELLTQEFTAFLRTPGEATLVCQTKMAPKDAEAESGWNALELVGPFAFTETGILAQIAVPLAVSGVAIYVLSTFNTDYVLIKADQYAVAVKALKQAGHNLIEN